MIVLKSARRTDEQFSLSGASERALPARRGSAATQSLHVC